MKKLFYFLVLVACFNVNAQTVGVGTTTPNTNSVLDIVSTNKGVLIPRITDTITVPTPPEGLIIYNKNTKSPYYYNGSRWVAMGTLPMTTSPATDKITYKVTATGFTSTEEDVFAISNGISKSISGIPGGGGTVGQTNFNDFSFTKLMDINTTKVTESVIKGTLLTEIEFKFYTTGASVPYISYKFKNVIISSYSVSASTGGGPVVENLSIAFGKYAFKDWVNVKEFGWDLSSNTVIPY